MRSDVGGGLRASVAWTGRNDSERWPGHGQRRVQVVEEPEEPGRFRHVHEKKTKESLGKIGAVEELKSFLF